MRKVTRIVVGAFLGHESAAVGNTMTDGKTLYLHGNAIARWTDSGTVEVTTARWDTATTRDRLRAIDSSICHCRGELFAAGAPWDGTWREVENPGPLFACGFIARAYGSSRATGSDSSATGS